MTFLPIVARELRVAARHRATYWSRIGTAFLAIVAGMIVYMKYREQPPHEVGTDLFITLCWMAYIYCLITGVSSTADCLSEEKREGTLGLLFLTDLRGYDVVLGKLVATSLNSFFGLLAIFPVLAVPLLMGGVTNGECWRAALVLVNTFFFSLSMGMLMSALCVSPGKAIATTLVFILAFSLGLPAACNMVPFVERSQWTNYVLQLICPNSPMFWLFDVDYTKSPPDYWSPVGALFGVSCLCLGLACFIVPRSWKDKPGGAVFQGWRRTWHNWNYGDAEERRAYRKRLLDINAFFWLAGRVRLKPGYVWAALAFLAGLWTWGAAMEGKSWIDPAMYFLTAIVLNSVLKIWVACEAGRRLGEDRRAGALELILSTPLSVAEIIRGQLLALRRQFLGPLLAVLIAQTILLLLSLQGGRSSGEDVKMAAAFAVVGMVMLIADMAALSCVAMWASLTARNPLRSPGIAMRRILLLPWVVIFLFYLMAWFFEQFFRRYEFSPFTFLFIYCVLGLLVDAWFGLRAWLNLHAEFRDAATRRFEVRSSFWSRLFGSGKSTAT